MSGRLLVLGLDPGFASMGWALAALTATEEQVLGLGVIRTDKVNKKQKVLAADDNLRRAREISVELHRLLAFQNGVSVICAESMSFPRNASAAAKVALSWGVIAALAESDHLPLVQASPQEVKKKVCGKKDASKEEVRDALILRYGMRAKDGGSDMLRHGESLSILSAMHVPPIVLLSDIPAGQHEHAWDALASIVASLDSEVIRLARRMVA